MFLTPFYEAPNKDKALVDVCHKAVKGAEKKTEIEANPYEVILAREVRNWFDSSKMIAIIHRNSMTAEEQFELQVPLKRANMYYKTYNRAIINEAFKDSPYEALKTLFNAPYGLIFSPDTDVAALEKILKKFSQVCLLAGILDGKFLSRDDFLKYGKWDITTARSGLVQVFQSAAGGNLNRQLTHHQSTLVTRLEQIGTKEKAPDENE